MAVQLTYHGTKPQSASNILSQGFKTGRLRSIAPGQIFSSNAPGFSSGYGSGTVRMVTPTSTFSLPSKNLATGVKGREFITSPKAGTRMANLASKLGTQYTGSTAGRLAAGQTVTGLGGRITPSLLSTASRFVGPVGIGIGAAQAGAALGDWAYKNIDPVTEFGDWAGGGIYNLIHGRQIKAREQLMNQRIMNQRKRQMQKYIQQQEAAEAAKKKVITTTPKGPPSITQKKTKPKVTGPTYGPHKKTKVKVKAKHSPHGGGPGSGGGGGSKKSGGGHKAPGGGGYGPHRGGRNPWGRADGGVVGLFKYGGFLG